VIKVDTEEAAKVFESLRDEVMRRHFFATLANDKDTIDNLNHEYDIITEVLEEIKHYEDGNHLHGRHLRGEIDDKPDNRFIFDFGDKKYIYFRVRPKKDPPEGWKYGGYPCRRICGGNFSRPHFTCIRGCWGHRIWYGKMPPIFEYKELGLITNPARPRWKRVLSKYACSFLEWLTS
jgi:hypothetical protein